MKKFSKLMFTSLILGGLIIPVSGCVKPREPFVPPESSDKVIINDAYDWNEDKDGSTRPDLGGGYEAQLPATDYLLTIADSSPVKFKDGSKSKRFSVEHLLSAEDFDESTFEGRTLHGLAVLNEESKISSFVELKSFTADGNVTVLPYFAPEHGDICVIGSNRVGDYYYDGDGADLSENSEYKIESESVLVDGLPGRELKINKPLKANAYFRCVTALEREDGQQYTYYYTAENRGDKAVSLTIYQMNGGHDYADSQNIKGDPFTLQPGERKTISIVFDNNKNDGNTLTLIKIDEAVESFDVAFVMAMENTTVTSPATITLNLPANFKVNGYVTAVRTNDKLVLPTKEQIENNTGHKLLYWVDGEGNTLKDGIRIKGDMTISPVLSEDAKVTFDLPAKFVLKPEYLAGISGLQVGDKLTLPTEADYTNGTGLKFIRWVDGDGNPLGKTLVLSGDITVKAELAQKATITVKLPAGLTLSGDYNKNSQTGEKLVVPAASQITGTISDGRRIEGWYIVGNGNQIITEDTEITDPDTVIAPYFSRREGTATICNSEGHNGSELIFSNVQTSNMPMNYYDVTGADIKSDSEKFKKFNAVNEWKNVTPIGAGEGGYAELGNFISYNGTIAAGEAFRCGTKISEGAAVVKKGVEHTFYYNFENLGAKPINLTVQAVNSGKSVEGPVNTIQLAPGESKLVEIRVTFNNGSHNKNVMAYFKAVDDVVDMKLGVSVNVVLGKEESKVTLKSGIDGFALTDEYLAAKRYVGEKLTLPAEGDYTDSKSADRKVIGWKDAAGNTLTNDTVLTGNITLVPVFEEYATVTVEAIDGITFTGGYELVKRYVVGNKLVLPAPEQINNTTGKAIQYWIIKGTSTVVDNNTVVTAAITVVPVLESDVKEEVAITLAQTEKFSLTEDYLNTKQYKGDRLVLPAPEQIVNETGKRLAGWQDASGNDLTEDSIIAGDIELHPVLVEVVTVTVNLPEGITLADGYNTTADKNSKLVLPASDQLDFGTSGYEAPLGWYNTADYTVVTAETDLTENITIAPYWQTLGGYTYLDIGSGSNSGYNTDEIPGDIAKNISASNYGGSKSGNPNKPVIVGNYLGSSLKIDTKISAGSAVRFDTAKPSKNPVIGEFKYFIENRGTDELRLSIYQINASEEYKAAQKYYGYETRYRIEVTLAAGESKTVVGQYDLGENGNFMTYMVVEKDISSLNLAFAMGYKTIEAVDDAYKGQAALVNPADIAYNPEDNGGITVKDSYLKQRAGRFALAPTEDDIVLPEGVTVAKWQLVIGETTYDLPTATGSYSDLLIPSSGATLKAVLAENVTVTYETANGVTVEGAKTAYKTGEKLSLPELTATTTDGRAHAGWFDKLTGTIVTNDTVVQGAMTLAPYFAPAGALTPLSGAKASEDGCAYGPDTLFDASATDPKDVTALKNNFTKTSNKIAGDEKGIILGYNGTLEENDAFRFKTTFNVEKKTYKYTYKFTNYGASEVKFTVYQITGGSVTEGMPKQEVTLTAGASAEVELTITYTGTNGNALTYFVMGGAVENMSLGVAMSVAEVIATPES